MARATRDAATPAKATMLALTVALTLALAAAMATGLTGGPARADPPEQPAKVAPRIGPPAPRHAGSPEDPLVVAIVHPGRSRGLVSQRPNGELDGFVPRVMEAVARSARLHIRMVVLGPDADPMDAITSGAADMVAPVTIHEDRMSQAKFTTPLLIVRGAVFRRLSTPRATSVEALQEHRVVVPTGGMSHEWVTESGIPAEAVGSIQSAFQRVLSGTADYAITTRISGRTEIADRGFRGLTDDLLDDASLRRAFVAAVKPGRDELVHDLNAGLEFIRESGEYDRLYERFLGSLQPLPPRTIISARTALALIAVMLAVSLAALAHSVASIRRLKRERAHLAESRARYRELFEGSPDGLMLLDPGELRPIEVNGSLRALLALPPADRSIVRLEDLDLNTGQETLRARLQSAMAAGQDSFDAVLRTRDGRRIDVVVRAQATTIAGRTLLLCAIRDITERRRAEEVRATLEAQVAQAQRLESLGVMVGGIVHDFNNLLAGILTNAELAQDQAPDGSPVARAAERIIAGARRGSDLTRQLLAYAGRASAARAPVDVGRLVEETRGLLETSLHGRATLDVRLSETPVLAHADETQMAQILMNLVTNAGEAMPARGGAVTVIVRDATLDRAALDSMLLGADAPPGPYAELRVTDTGSGMERSTLERIFDPFFTTKADGRGMGLAAVLGIVRSHKGVIDAHSIPGEGSTIGVYIPRSSAARPAPPPPPPPVAAPAAGAQVLIVDDEAIVRQSLGMAVGAMGFSVQACECGNVALNAVRSGACRPRVAIVDRTMPGISGEELVRQLRELIPELPIIVTSGYAERGVVEWLTAQPRTWFLEKPFRLGQLQAALGVAIGEVAPTT